MYNNKQTLVTSDNMKKSINLKQYEDVDLRTNKRHQHKISFKEIKTLSMSKRGRVTIPQSIWNGYKFKGEYYTIKHNPNDNTILILFSNSQTELSKKLSDYNKKTRYIEIGPVLKKLNYKIHADNLNFKKLESHNAIILYVKSLL